MTDEAIQGEFAKLLANNAYLRHAYTRAVKAGSSEEECLMSLLVEMDRLNKRALLIMADAFTNGMPIAQEIAAIQIVDEERDE